MPFFNTMAELPTTYGCRKCGQEKPVGEMIVGRVRKTGKVFLRPRCKACQNAFERGRRLEYKRAYRRRWRRHNAELNETYWRKRCEANGEAIAARARQRFCRDHAAILIQGRIRRQLGMTLPIAEARELARQFGPCYPTRFGLTPGGLHECERIRSRLRRARQAIRPIEIRMMVYADGHYIKPNRQKTPYRIVAERMRRWHAERRQARAA